MCGDDMDLVDGQPTGSVRVSFGYMSTLQDAQNCLTFIAECFLEGVQDKPKFCVHVDKEKQQEEDLDKNSKILFESEDMSDSLMDNFNNDEKHVAEDANILDLQSTTAVSDTDISHIHFTSDRTKNALVLPCANDEQILNNMPHCVENKEFKNNVPNEKNTQILPDCDRNKEIQDYVPCNTKNEHIQDNVPKSAVESVSKFIHNDLDVPRCESSQRKCDVYKDEGVLQKWGTDTRILSDICLYPVKSCAAFKVSTT